MRRAWWMGFALLVGCSGSRPNTTQVRTSSYATDRGKIIDEASSRMVSPTCDAASFGMRACGLIADKFLSETETRRFETDACAELPPEECKARYMSAFTSALASRYDEATHSDVTSYCAGADCSDWRVAEIGWARSHNGRVMANAKQRLSARDRQQANDLAAIERARAERARAAAALRATGAAMQQFGTALQAPDGATSSECRFDVDCGVGRHCVRRTSHGYAGVCVAR